MHHEKNRQYEIHRFIRQASLRSCFDCPFSCCADNLQSCYRDDIAHRFCGKSLAIACAHGGFVKSRIKCGDGRTNIALLLLANHPTGQERRQFFNRVAESPDHGSISDPLQLLVQTRDRTAFQNVAHLSPRAELVVAYLAEIEKCMIFICFQFHVHAFFAKFATRTNIFQSARIVTESVVIAAIGIEAEGFTEGRLPKDTLT